MEINTETIHAMVVEIEGAKKRIKEGELVQFDDGLSLIRTLNHPDAVVHIFIDKVKIGEALFDDLSKKKAFNTLTHMLRNLITAATKQSADPYLNKEKLFSINDNVVQFDN